MQLSKGLLEVLGLSEAQAKVYEAALELGESSMQELAKKSGIIRTTIYSFMDVLKDRGFITETKKGKRRVYSATHPERLLDVSKARVVELETAMPELMAIYNSQSTQKPRVTFYDGIDGVLEVYADMLDAGQVITAYEDHESRSIGLPKAFYEYFPTRLAENDILFRSIARDSKVAREFAKEHEAFPRETKFLNTEIMPAEISIYGNKSALMSFKADSPLCVLIEDEAIANTLRMTWQELWSRL